MANILIKDILPQNSQYVVHPHAYPTQKFIYDDDDKTISICPHTTNDQSVCFIILNKNALDTDKILYIWTFGSWSEKDIMHILETMNHDFNCKFLYKNKDTIIGGRVFNESHDSLAQFKSLLIKKENLLEDAEEDRTESILIHLPDYVTQALKEHYKTDDMTNLITSIVKEHINTLAT